MNIKSLLAIGILVVACTSTFGVDVVGPVPATAFKCLKDTQNTETMAQLILLKEKNQLDQIVLPFFKHLILKKMIFVSKYELSGKEKESYKPIGCYLVPNKPL